MKELKILGVIVFFTLLTYWGVEPFPTSVREKHVESHNFTYQDLKAVTAKGDAAAGKTKIAACIGCHGIKSQGMKAPMNALASSGVYGVNPPDLSNAGNVYSTKFLVNFLQHPAKVAKSKHIAMPQSASNEQDAADIVAYLKSIAPKKISNKEAYELACGRCHAMRYAKWTQIGTIPKTKKNIKTDQNIALLTFQSNVAKYQNKLADYMGKLPPDLSIIIRARSEEFLKTLVEDPQGQLKGTAMPRVGLTKDSYKQVKGYLEEVGDPSKPKREAVGPWVIGFFFIFTILAYLWKESHWKNIH